MSGTIVGVVERSGILDGKSIRPGDAVIGIASSGLHTNGYSLARKIFFERMNLKPSSHLAELSGTIGEELLKVHLSYGRLVQALLKKFNRGALAASRESAADSRRGSQRRSSDTPPGVIKGLVHITGGGFVDNIPRVLPKGCDVVIRKGWWDMPPIFQIIKAKGGVPEEELYQVFNMGIGMTVIVPMDKAEAALRFIRTERHRPWIIGEVVRGNGQARIL